jgi:hypothetical protein
MIIAASIFDRFSSLAPTLQVSTSTDRTSLRLNVVGEGNWSYDILSSTNLALWQFTTNVFIDTFRSTNAAIVPLSGRHQFYKAVLSAPDQ